MWSSGGFRVINVVVDPNLQWPHFAWCTTTFVTREGKAESPSNPSGSLWVQFRQEIEDNEMEIAEDVCYRTTAHNNQK